MKTETILRATLGAILMFVLTILFGKAIIETSHQLNLIGWILGSVFGTTLLASGVALTVLAIRAMLTPAEFFTSDKTLGCIPYYPTNHFEKETE